MTIVKKIELVQGHEFRKLSACLLAALVQGADRVGHSTRANWLAFEAFLQLADRPSANIRDISTSEFRRSVEIYIGALTSSKFLGGTKSTRFQHGYRLLKALNNIDPHGRWNQISLAAKGASNKHGVWRAEFEALDVDPEIVWLWSGWGGTTKRGIEVSFPLYPVYKRMGRDFTERFCTVLQSQVGRQASPTFKVLSYFCQYIGSAEFPIEPTLFLDRYWCGKFFNGLGRAFFKEMGKRGNVIRHAAKGWKHYLLPLVDALSRDGLIAAPEPPVPSPRAGVVVRGKETHVRKTAAGALVKRTCLTEIPLALSDTAAKEILFKEIVEDFGAVVTWAEKEAEGLWTRHMAESPRLS